MRASHYNERVDGDLGWRVVRAWHAAFLLLQFERCQPFLADAGVPPPVVADSRDLRDAARRFVRGNAAVFAASQEEALRILEESSQTGQTDHSKPAWQRKAEARSWAILRGRAALATEALARLVEVYGEEEARLLHEWVQHQFASRSPGRWQAWCVLLPALAGVSDHRPPDVASPLAPEAWGRFARTVSRRFNRATVAHDMRRLRTAFRSPMSAEDQELERRHPYHSKPKWGALARAQYAVGRERAYQVWKELDMALDAEEREAVLRWGRDEALARNMYQYLPALHDHMGVVARYACPSCGYYTFHKWPPGMESSFDICPVCFWEDDAVATRMPTFVGSSRVSLEQARENFRAFGAVRERLTEYVRPPLEDELPHAQAWCVWAGEALLTRAQKVRGPTTMESDSKRDVLRVTVVWGERRAPELPYVVEVSPGRLAPHESLIGMDIDSAGKVLAKYGWQMKRFEMHGPKQEYTLERERP